MTLLRRAATTSVPSLVQFLCLLVSWASGAAIGQWPPLIPAAVSFGLLAVPAAAIDSVEHRIPNQLSLPLAGAMTISLAGAAFVARDSVSGVRALVGALVWGGLLLMSFLLTGQPGPGDVKLAPSIGALLGWFGWPCVLGGLVTTYLLTAAVGVVGAAAGRYRLRDGHVPMGPPMVAAALILSTLAQS
ncbi:A24 family peptidase [Amycolatopsis sp. NPDC051371]|uniref:A24 family peptidase n=1 Tax=Amycolatopsis sp. NPDC051371 TaxID=3155800 RepID=UPI00343B983B